MADILVCARCSARSATRDGEGQKLIDAGLRCTTLIDSFSCDGSLKVLSPKEASLISDITQWFSEWPTEPGYYWFYGWPYKGEWERKRPPVLKIVEVACPSGLLEHSICLCAGAIWFKTEWGGEGKFLSMTPPELPTL